MFAAVMTQAAVRAERQATLGQMESWTLEYAVTGRKPAGALPTLEIYDTRAGPAAQSAGSGCARKSFSGVVEPRGPAAARGRTAVRRHARRARSCSCSRWTSTGRISSTTAGAMIVRTANARSRTERQQAEHQHRLRRQRSKEVFGDNIGSNIIWGDLTDLTDWQTGTRAHRPQPVHADRQSAAQPLLVLLRRLRRATTSTSWRSIIAGLTALLMAMYVVAALFAAVLIFCISRAVNRIEKGTRAVERGDFSYRIKMKRHNQLGAMAQSFDRMTESIGSLLARWPRRSGCRARSPSPPRSSATCCRRKDRRSAASRSRRISSRPRRSAAITTTSSISTSRGWRWPSATSPATAFPPAW